MELLLYILIFTIISGVLSLAGGLALLSRASLVRRFSVHFVSFAVGALLGTAFLDLLPEAFELNKGKTEFLLIVALGGVIGFFILESLILRFHHYHTDEDSTHHHAAPTLLVVGDTIHNFIDGVVVAVAFLTSVPLGIVSAIAIAAHELPQEIGDFSVMLHHGWERTRVLWVNVLSSFAAVVGAVLAFVGRDLIEPFLPQLLAVTAGIFIYIATADLMPELSPHHKTDKSSHIFILVLAGVAAVWVLSRYLNFG